VNQTIQTTVVQIENEQGEHPAVMLRCSEGEAIPPKATVSAKAILCEQEVLIVGTDRLKIRGKGKPSVCLGDLVEIRVIAETS
jgi:hypothetical protein